MSLGIAVIREHGHDKLNVRAGLIEEVAEDGARKDGITG